MKERDAATEKTGKNKYSFCRSNPINKKGAKTSRCAATYLNEFNEISRGERKGFAFEKSAQFIGSERFNHCFTGWNSFHRLHIVVQAEESES